MTTVQFSAEFGGLDVEKVILPHFLALKSAFENEPFEGFPLPELAFILRVDGDVTDYGPSGAEHIKFDRKGRYVSVDIGITRDDIAQANIQIAGRIVRAIMSGVDMLMAQRNARLESTDWVAVQRTLQLFANTYQRAFA